MQPFFTFIFVMRRNSLTLIFIAVAALCGCKPAGIETGNAGGADAD